MGIRRKQKNTFQAPVSKVCIWNQEVTSLVNSSSSVEPGATPKWDSAKTECLPDPLWLCKHHTALLKDLCCFLEANLIFKLKPTKRRLTTLKKYLTTSLLAIKWPIRICQMSTVDDNPLNKHFCLKYLSLLKSSLRHKYLQLIQLKNPLLSKCPFSSPARYCFTILQFHYTTYS